VKALVQDRIVTLYLHSCVEAIRASFQKQATSV